MKRRIVVVLALFVVVVASAASAQGPEPPKPRVPLEIEVVIARFDGTKKISSLPYILAVNANGTEVQLNMGTDVAVPSTAFTPAANDQKVNPVTSYNYRSVGTRIQARANTAEDGRFELQLFIDDSSVYTNPTALPGGAQLPAFRSFSSRNTLLLRDGQTREYTAATDRVSGEVVRVSVTVKIVK